MGTEMTIDNPIILKIIEAARTNLKNSEVLLPIFFVGGPSGIEIVAAHFSDNDRSKDVAAALVRKTAQKLDADFVVFVAESWTLPPEAAKEFLKAPRRWDSVSEHPEAYEIVAFTVETRSRDMMGRAKILPDREMGPIEWNDVPVGSSTGRFTNFLSPRGVKS